MKFLAITKIFIYIWMKNLTLKFKSYEKTRTFACSRIDFG